MSRSLFAGHVREYVVFSLLTATLVLPYCYIGKTYDGPWQSHPSLAFPAIVLLAFYGIANAVFDAEHVIDSVGSTAAMGGLWIASIAVIFLWLTLIPVAVMRLHSCKSKAWFSAKVPSSQRGGHQASATSVFFIHLVCALLNAVALAIPTGRYYAGFPHQIGRFEWDVALGGFYGGASLAFAPLALMLLRRAVRFGVRLLSGVRS